MIKYQGKIISKINANYIVISSVSLSHTPSRALDILIASNQFKRIGFLDSQFIEPAVGYLNKKIEGGSLGLSGQVYLKDDVAIIQLRSNIRFGRKKQFVEQLGQLLQNVFNTSQALVIGSLPQSLRHDLEIQAVSKNTYYYSKPQNTHLKIAQQNNQLKSIKLLIDHDEEVTDILGESGIIKNILKSQYFTKINYLCVFSQNNVVDQQAAVKLAKAVSFVSGKKQLGIVQNSILDV